MRILIISLLLLLLIGCSPTLQVWETTSTNSRSTENFWTHENDLVRITYYFWSDKGIMSFSIYNKTDKPLYVDWKNSSFIHNGTKLNYWIDEEFSALTSYYGGFFYSGPIIKPGSAVNSGTNNSVSKTIKPERITFIPPNSNYDRSSFYLMPSGNYNIDQGTTEKKTTDEKQPNKRNTFYEADFSYEDSPLNFRNYLAFSHSESSKDFIFIDNEFYVQNIKQMSKKVFKGEILEDHVTYSYPFSKGSSFYIEIAPFDPSTYDE